MSKIPVKDHRNLYRDSSSKAIVNTDITGYQSYISNREKLQENKDRIDNLELDLEEVKNSLHDIKDLLMKIVDK